MLALTRKKGESIMVGSDVEVIVLGVQGDQVKLGFVAPKNVAIHRKEIYKQIQDENKAASDSININLSDLYKLKM
jgi:carbon storage regulator